MAGTSTTVRPRERNSTITVLLETVLSKCSPRTCRLEKGAGNRQGSPGAQSRASFGIGTTQTLGHICVGNFYRKRLQNEPYEIFVNTMQQYVEQLFGLLNAPELVACGRAVQQAIGKDEELVTRVFPSVKRLLGQPSQRKVIFSGPAVEERIGMATLYRFHLVFAKLFAALTEYMPMAIFLNNVQWADTESLSILRLLMRSEPMAITIICGYQFFRTSLEGKSRGSDTLSKSEHVPDDDLDRRRQRLLPFQSTLNELISENSAHITVVDLEGLEHVDLCVFLSNVLQNENDEQISKLASLIHSHTEGNAFHVKQLLHFLIRRGLISRETDNDKASWHWDNGQLQNSLESVDSILDLTREPLLKLSRVAREVLKVASCL